MGTLLHGKIYQIVSLFNPRITYIGSTINTLEKRWKDHLNAFKMWASGGLKRGTSLMKFFIQYGTESFTIQLIKEYSVVDRNHLKAYEQLWISKMKCVNVKNTLFISKLYFRGYNKTNQIKIARKNKEYREKNKDQLSVKKKIYYENNKEVLNDRAKVYGEINREKKKEYLMQYYQDNKKKLKENSLQYYNLHKEDIGKKQAEKMKCECGAKVTKRHLTRHKKTKKHQSKLY